MNHPLKLIDYASVIMILLFAMALRIAGIAQFGWVNPDYMPSSVPYQMSSSNAPVHPDEYVLASYPIDMLLHERLNPTFFEYPSGLMYLNALTFQLTGMTKGMSLDVRSNESLRVYAPFSAYVMGRMVSVLLGVMVVACGYGIMRIVAGKFTALVTSFMLASAYILVHHAHYLKPGTPASGMMMLALWANIVALYTQRAKTRMYYYLLAGILTGASATIRYNAASIGLILLLVGLILLYRHRSRKMLATILVSWIFVPIIFIMGTPYALLEFREFYQQFRYISGQFLSTATNIPTEIVTTPLEGFSLVFAYYLLFGVGFVGVIAVLLGIFGAWRDNRPIKNWQWLQKNSTLLFSVLILIFLLVYILVTMRTIRPLWTDNLLILIVPQTLLLSALGVGWVYQRMPKSILVAPILIVIVVIQPLALSLPALTIFQAEDTRNRMQTWVYEHIPIESTFFLVEPYNVPLDPALYAYEQQFNLLHFELSDVEGFDYLILSDNRLHLYENASLVTDAEFAPWQAKVDLIETNFIRLAWLDRPQIPRYLVDMMNPLLYWHQPSLMLYCLHEDACRAIFP